MSGKDPKGYGKGSNKGSAKGSGKGYKGQDPVYYQDPWGKGRGVYDEVMNQRRAQQYQGDAWGNYNDNYVTYRTVPRPQGGPRPQRPVRPKLNRNNAGGAEYFQMDTEGEEEEDLIWDDLTEDAEIVSQTPASVPLWARSQPRSDRSINTLEREQRARLRKLTLGDTFEDKLTRILESLVNQKSQSGDRGSRNLKLTNIICDKWSGDKRLTAKQYRAWKKKVKGIAKYYY